MNKTGKLVLVKIHIFEESMPETPRSSRFRWNQQNQTMWILNFCFILQMTKNATLNRVRTPEFASTQLTGMNVSVLQGGKERIVPWKWMNANTIRVETTPGIAPISSMTSNATVYPAGPENSAIKVSFQNFIRKIKLFQLFFVRIARVISGNFSKNLFNMFDFGDPQPGSELLLFFYGTLDKIFALKFLV